MSPGNFGHPKLQVSPISPKLNSDSLLWSSTCLYAPLHTHKHTVIYTAQIVNDSLISTAIDVHLIRELAALS